MSALDGLLAGGVFAGWAIDALIASTVLMLLVLLVRTPVRKAFGPQLAYALWVLPVLRLALPPMPQGWRAAATPISRAGETLSVYVIEPTAIAASASASAAAVSESPSLGVVVGAIWAAGALAFLVWHLVQHSRFCRRMLGTAERLDDAQGVRVIASPAAPGPLAFGIVRRYVAFPRDFDDRYDADERELALAHELGHHQRGDLIANWIALVVLALHWFNPVAWRAFRRFRADQELANDARVLAGRSAVDRHIYACAIVKAAHGGAVSAACHLHTITDLKGRLRMLTTSRVSRRRIAAGATSIAILVAAGLGLTASGTRAAASVTTGIETATGLTLSAPLSAPPTPPVPAADDTAGNVRRVVVVNQGKTTVYEGAEADRYIARHPTPVPPTPPMPRIATVGTMPSMPSMPTMATMPSMPSMPQAGVAPPAPPVPARPITVPVTSGNCGVTGGKAYTMTRREGGSTVTVICTDRIEAAARAGQMTEADQAGIQRQAMTGALQSLRQTRMSLAGNTALGADERNEAVGEIDSAIKKMEGEIADIGKG